MIHGVQQETFVCLSVKLGIQVDIMICDEKDTIYSLDFGLPGHQCVSRWFLNACYYWTVHAVA